MLVVLLDVGVVSCLMSRVWVGEGVVGLFAGSWDLWLVEFGEVYQVLVVRGWSPLLPSPGRVPGAAG